MNNKEICSQILTHVGGRNNVNEITHCMTRLRITVKDMTTVNMKALDKLEGIMGAVIKGDQIQIVIGNEINAIYNEFSELVGTLKTEKTKNSSSKLDQVLNTISGIFNPIVPALAGAGIIKALLVVLKLTGLLDGASNTYIVLNTISDSVFTFLPFLLAYSSAKKFKCNPYIAVGLAGALMHPNFTTMIAAGNADIDFLGMPLKLVSYASSVFPIILGVLLLSFVEKSVEKFMPGPLKIVFVPALTLLITAPLVLLVVGPLANVVGNFIANGFETLFDKGGVIAGVIYGGVYSLMVVTGLHHGMVPVLVSNIANTGFNTISPASGSANMGQAGAAFAVFLKSKSQKTKAVAASATISALLGVTEPAIYGVNLRLKKPFLSAAIGGMFGGGFAALMGCRAYAMGGPSFVTIPMFIGDDGGKWIYVVIAFLIAFVVSAIATFIIGFEEISLDEQEGTLIEHKSSEKLQNAHVIVAPVDGEVVPLSDVPDPTFAKEMMGYGVAIQPSSDDLYAPITGVVTSLFKTGHAIGITGDDGVEVLLHIGIDTVKLDGKGFTCFVKQGDQVKVNQKLVQIDREFIESNGYSTMSVVVVTNRNEFPNYSIHDCLYTKHGDALLDVAKA